MKSHPASITRLQPYSRREADGIMREAMANRRVGPIKRNIIWLAVRVGGWLGWSKPDKVRQRADEAEFTM